MFDIRPQADSCHRARRCLFRTAARETFVLWSFVLLASTVSAQDFVARVDGRPVTQADLELEAVLRRVPEGATDRYREMLLSELVEHRLIQGFLERRKVKVDRLQLDSQMERIEALIRRRGEEPQAFYDRLGLEPDRLRDRLSTSLAWKNYIEQTTSDRQLREYFQRHRRELDGTQLRARHIIVKVPPDDVAGRASARHQLARIRQSLLDGELSFEEAARKHSQGPSGERGGDVGYFAHRGTMSAKFADAAFALQQGELSEPVETPFGVHLIEVTDERPGQLSLEDVRPQVLERFSRQRWDETVAAERQRAVIETNENGSR